jgi:hypothetical protein
MAARTVPAVPVALAALRVLALGLAVGLGLGAAGCKADAEKCDQACRNFAKLQYWVKADQDIAAAPADQRDALRQRKLGEYSRGVEEGIDLCVRQCQSARPDVDCMIAATTADQVKACIDK